VNDTLSLSLGIDKKVVVSREKVVDFESQKFIGTKKEVSRAWQISAKNNKSETISMIILDQVPLSTASDMEVLVQNLDGGEKNSDTGEVKWVFDLDAGASKKMNFKYSVKYPKNRSLIVD